MPINPIPQPVDVIINPSGEPPKIKDFIINAPLIVQSTNVKNKLDTITKETDNLSTRLSALESSIDSNITNITNISSNASGSFFFSNSPNIIETSGSLYLSGAIKSSYISSSTGAYITGSVTQGYSGNIASGNYSHAEGQATIAYGAGSHAEGYQTNASGDYCHTEGQDTYVTTLGDYSHAEGHFTKVDNRYAHAEGYGTLASGLYAHAEGYLTTGSGQASHAEGQNTTAGGAYSHTEGKKTYTFDRGSGQPTQRGSGSHAEGEESSATGNFSHAEGYQAAASGAWSHAEGYQTTGSGEASHAEGERTTALNFGSHAEGYFTVAGSNGSHAEGFGSYTFSLAAPDKLGYSAHAEGQETSVCGNYAHSEGYQTHASGAHSHAEGDNTITFGASSHAEGLNTISSGSYSHAGGHGTIASGSYQTVVGNYNKRLNTTSLFVVGNGTGDSDALRGDIFRAESTGELVLSGGIRHKVLYSSLGVTAIARERYMYVFDTYAHAANITVGLPAIDLVADIGLTFVIRQTDSDVSLNTVTIGTNSNTTIVGFNSEWGYSMPAATFNLATLGGTAAHYTRRSITLTYTGYEPLSGKYRWTVMASSEC